MAQEGTSLSAVASNGTFTGAAVTPTTPFANASMVVTMSGYSAEELTRRGQNAHPQLQKPFTLPQLIAFVNDAFAADRAVA